MDDDATLTVSDPPTEPIDDLPLLPPSPPIAAKPPDPPTPAGTFGRSLFQFMSGIRAGDTAYIRGEDGNALLSYRSFASVVGIIAALMSAVVLIAGAGGVLFLLMERRPLPAIAAMILSAGFAAMIVMLVPATNVTIFEGGTPAITITQQAGSSPSVTWVVTAPDGQPIARIHKPFMSRFGRNRWTIANETSRGAAVEESLGRALIRKLFGKFSRAYQSNLRVTWDGHEAGWFIRRPDLLRRADVLELHPATTLDRRAAVALAVLVLGSEP
ncbi:MAG: hypothetical protein QOC81_900 [Thermoanaerobaculia bacterium]|nr:hypothetical protein [Thermoanaerobaculia bacterium]